MIDQIGILLLFEMSDWTCRELQVVACYFVWCTILIHPQRTVQLTRDYLNSLVYWIELNWIVTETKEDTRSRLQVPMAMCLLQCWTCHYYFPSGKSICNPISSCYLISESNWHIEWIETSPNEDVDEERVGDMKRGRNPCPSILEIVFVFIWGFPGNWTWR